MNKNNNTNPIQTGYRPDTDEWRPASWQDCDGLTDYWCVVDDTESPHPVAICPRGKETAEAICDYKQRAQDHWGIADEARYAQFEDSLTLAVQHACTCGGGGPLDDHTCPACLTWHWYKNPALTAARKDSTRLTAEPVNSGSCNDDELGKKGDQS